jgi:hypothetical protein
VTLDWSSIRPLNGGRDKGFEELCAQLARVESPNGSTFVRKGTPDAGVECYTILDDGTEWGWQSKYIDGLGDSQWSQIDASIKTALEKHPKLVRYFVCVPLDRADAREAGRKSAKERWDEHVAKWTSRASDRGMTVEFTYWGSHELLELLARPEHIGRVRFWFDVRGFDAAWFTARLHEALRTAGPRYSPEVHVDLPIALELEAFGRTERFFEREKARARTIREKLKHLEYSESTADATVDGAVAIVSAKVQAVLKNMSTITAQPTGLLPFNAIVEHLEAAEQAAEDLSQFLDQREQEFEAKSESVDAKAPLPSYRSNPFRNRGIRLLRLTHELQTARESFIHADGMASSALMLLRGAAGTGKTHLLCDIAQQRLTENKPTILLMGQRFVSNDAPWSQASQQLDLSGLSAEEFVGALEAAAQAAGSRALLVIDAINEGAGRAIWPIHLSAFLAHLERSPWIGVILAIRSSYEEIIVPAEVRAHAAIVTHQGFTEHEYDATRTFFAYYGLELPSTPLLAPEFWNPLFLKTLCKGLHAKGKRRLPRGYHGITAVFDLYLSAVNERLAPNLGFDARTPLVHQALEAVARAILDSGKAWLTLAKAAEIVNAFLPGRDFERSLYRGLVVEGVLVEEAARYNGLPTEEVVFVGYERFADHLAAKILLDRHLDRNDPACAFAQGGQLAFICDKRKYVSPGLLEALCIQIPERVGKELISIAPTCVERWGLGDAFRQSLVWRAYSAFSGGTLDILSKLCRSANDLNDTIDVLLTVATLPEHQLNARFLDRRLRQNAMPDRDAWWSVYLHQASGAHGAVDRLVDWAFALDPGTGIDDETVDLCALTLSWILTTSNRFLRDRATKALVCLLTGRLAAATRLVQGLTDVDDPYVVERVYAVAYGVTMRSHDPAAVGALAQCVYDRVFASGSPRPHILLRDYARGVIERALHLGSAINVLPHLIRPPYKSTWPTIPTEESIKSLLPDWSKGSYDSGELEWARNRIGSSVMDGDFARYIIGMNWASTSRCWLSLVLDEPPWKPPPSPEDQLQVLFAELSAEERMAWDEFAAADRVHVFAALLSSAKTGKLKEAWDEAFAALRRVLTVEHAQRLEPILVARETYHKARRPPGFDLRQMQRYILWRVFDLGWTTERFGYFERFSIDPHGRETKRAERISKKYQWIAYHEILAFLSDRFQYRDESREEGDKAYEGPWQDHLREIDPSCTLKSLRGGTSWDGHAAAWWGTARYDSWVEPNNPHDWVLKCDDLPKVEDLLVVRNPADGSRWVNGQGYFIWRQQPPADRESTEVNLREIWYTCTGYLLRKDDAQLFLKWSEEVDFWGHWMSNAARVYGMFLGEYAWAPASLYFQKPYYGDDGWTQPNQGCPVRIRTVSCEYAWEAGGSDHSIDESYTLRLPVSELITGLGIRWSGHGADFVDTADQVVVQDPTVHREGPSAILLREDRLQEFLTQENLTLCWAVLGEKRVLSPYFGTGSHQPALRMSGAYVVSEGRAKGFIKYLLDDPGREERKGRPASLKVIRVARSKV